MTDEVDQAYERWRSAAEKFDHFMAGLSAALLGYVVTTMEPARLGLNPGTLEILGTASLLGSTVAALSRIEATVHVVRLGAEKLRIQDQRTKVEEAQAVFGERTGKELHKGKIVGDLRSRDELIQKHEKQVARKAELSYSARNYLLLLGLVFLVAAQVWKGYYL